MNRRGFLSLLGAGLVGSLVPTQLEWLPGLPAYHIADARHAALFPLEWFTREVALGVRERVSGLRQAPARPMVAGDRWFNVSIDPIEAGAWDGAPEQHLRARYVEPVAAAITGVLGDHRVTYAIPIPAPSGYLMERAYSVSGDGLPCVRGLQVYDPVLDQFLTRIDIRIGEAS